MATLRKYSPIFVENKVRKSPFTLERCLLAGFVGLTGLGLAQPAILSVAFDSTTPSATQIAQGKPSADFTPVGSIERKPAEPAKPEQPADSPGLRLNR